MQDHLASSKVVVRSGFFNLLGYGASALYMLLILPLIVGYVGIEEYGLWTLVLALSGYVGLMDLGIGTSFVPYIARYVSLASYDEVNKVVQHGLLFYVGISLIVVAAGYAVAASLFSLVNLPAAYLESARLMFLLALLGFAFSSVAGVFGSVLTALQRVDAFNALLVGFLLLKLATIAVVLELGYGLMGVMWADLTITIISIVPFVIMARKFVPQLSLRWSGYDAPLMRSLIGFGTKLQVSRIADIVQAHFDKLILSRFVGLSAVSMYDFGSRPGGRLRALPLTAIASLVPAVSALNATDEAGRIRAAVVRSTRYLAIVAVGMFAFFLCFAGQFVEVWLGSGFERAAMVLRVLSLGHLVGVVASAMSFAAQGMGKPEIQMHTTLVQAVLNVLLSLGLVSVYGFYGAVAGTSISAIVAGLLFFSWFGRRLVDRPMTVLLTSMGKPLLSVIPAAAVGFAMITGADFLGVPESRMERGVLLALMAILFAGTYVIALILLKTLTADDKGFVEAVTPSRFRFILRFF
jgi:O-antigen/teichoic acid export membrane protein